MRVAPNQLLIDGVEGVPDVKKLLFGGNLGVENCLQHEIAQFRAQFIPILAVDRIQHLIGFFQGVLFDRVESLLAIPRAATRSSQPPHDVDQPLELRTHVVFGHLRGILNVSFG